ncbi:Tyrosyl-tRNA synthetase [Caldalkalibacillus thermarum TA2.A1]|uniref:Tyrosine--tRNA ligase n=1 Tax=Caldalkalibacillus thermarum (strain TA2.A1) TaxID=986075 RepID=F5L3X8_CALTT|nr:tyrosine--tRNA ligase [Caldalkalibacillus thermarum]EGL83956.1 Tyrosyl-tRNA synthetase [Caldalkalibacillus thermarum TA2.A1]QZT35062.1 tyrosine--tRNA ligase [Caldalkalibacillus thermarum TA2.A1]
MSEQISLTPAQQKEVDRQFEILKRGVVEIVPEEGLKQKLARSIATDTPLKVKLGVDPTAPDIHLGHTVVIQKLRQFQELGHTVQFLIGDFTARIGDPTGRSETRKPLTEEQVKQNAKTYVQQYAKILDMSKTELHYNSKWLSALNFADVLELAAKTTVARMLERDDFEKRYRANQAISLHEFFYPLMQGYDSVALECDVELGGTDQKFNLLMGRHLQKEYGQEPQVAIMTPLLEGLDGVQKMSKSLGNYIGIDEEPNEIYGKTMSIPDELMIKYYELVTRLPLEEVKRIEAGLKSREIHPRDAKMRLAKTLVAMYHGDEAAEQAEEHFKTVFQKRDLPEDMPEKEWTGASPVNIVDLLHGLDMVVSKGEGRRMVQQGAVRINGDRVNDIQEEVNVRAGMIVQVGKRKFVRIK